jgi:transcriptional regulator with XRE-family HTH domain
MPLKNPNEILAQNLRFLRVERGWSQEDLADRCHLHRTYIGAIERGERNVTLNTLYEIANALTKSPAELISENTRRAGRKS